MNKVKVEIPLFTNLAKTAALKNVENKIPDQSKYITTPEFNELTAENLTARIKHANLATKDNTTGVGKKILMIN